MYAQSVIPSDVHYHAREHRLQGYSGLRKAVSIALLWDNEPTPMPTPSVRARPLKPLRPPPPPPKDAFAPYKLEQAFRGELIGASESMKKVGWTWKPSLEKPEEASLISRPENSVIWM